MGQTGSGRAPENFGRAGAAPSGTSRNADASVARRFKTMAKEYAIRPATRNGIAKAIEANLQRMA